MNPALSYVHRKNQIFYKTNSIKTMVHALILKIRYKLHISCPFSDGKVAFEKHPESSYYILKTYLNEENILQDFWTSLLSFQKSHLAYKRVQMCSLR